MEKGINSEFLWIKDSFCKLWLKLTLNVTFYHQCIFFTTCTSESTSSPFRKWKKLEFSLPNMPSRVLFELAQCFWRRNFVEEMLLLYFTILIHVSPIHFLKIKYPPAKSALCQVWLKLALWFWWRSWTNGKFLKYTKKQTIWTVLTEAYGTCELKGTVYQVSQTQVHV